MEPANGEVNIHLPGQGRDKREVMLELMEDAWVYVQLDPRREGVQLPDYFLQEKRLILQYGYNMPVPIDDLTVDERGISATLSFKRAYHRTFVPWSAVFVVSDGDKRNHAWPADMPADLQVEAPGEGTDTKTESAPPAPAAAAPGKPGKKPRPSHLKLVD